MEHLLRSAASSPQSMKTHANPCASTRQSNFHPKTPPEKLSTFKHLKIYYRNGNCRLRLRHVPPLAANGSVSPPPHSPPPTPPPSDFNSNDKKFAVVACSAVTVALAIANRVLYKLALVPMKEFPFFLAQLITFGYVAIYFSVLYMRYRAGIATNEMLAYPKSRFIIIGLLEAIGAVSGMYSGAMLPGPAIPILNQLSFQVISSNDGTFLVWQLAFSVLLLGRTYTLNRLAGCFLVAAGVVLAVTSGSENDQILSGVAFVWPAMMIASTAFQAVASVVKESVFIDAATRLKGKLLDIFVVNSFGSGFQSLGYGAPNCGNLALFVLLFLPLLSNMKGIPFSELPSYLNSGAACFFNVGTSTTGCDGAPILPLLYIITNIAFNISVLNLLKFSSAVVSSLAVASSVPISIYILSLPLPYLPEGVSLSPYFVLGSIVLMTGLVIYNLSWPIKQDSTTL